jgi:hypothetical protein
MISALRSLVSAVWRIGVVFWVCRVPLASTLVAGFLIVLTPQGRDLFADLALSWQWAVFFLLCFCWAWIVHGGARHALQCDDWVPDAHEPGGLTDERRATLQAEFHVPAVWIPRLLGLIVLVLVGAGIWLTFLNMQDAAAALPEVAAASQLSLGLLIVTAAITIVFIWLVVNWRTKINRRAGEPPVAPCLAGRLPLFANLFEADDTRKSKTQLDTFVTWARRVIFVLIIVGIALPLLAAAWTPRLFFLPLLFAGIVLFLGELANWSHRLRTPLLLIVVAVSVICTNSVVHFHDVRWIIGAAFDPAARQIDLTTAVNRWKAANDCTDQVSQCPRPILIAGAGGASRAAFLPASVVGTLLDLDNKDLADEIGHVRPRIFALSTVSGSSVGAAVIRAAMVDASARANPEKPPCIQEGTGSWFGTWARPRQPNASFDVKTSWRDCFQTILAGDFLSPVFVGLAYRDNFPLPDFSNNGALWGDRAQLLEQSFEARYHRMAQGSRAIPCRERVAEAEKQTGLCRPFGYHQDPGTGPDAWKRWVPILLLNATSVTTGRRIIVSDIKLGPQPSKKVILWPFAYDLWELRVPAQNPKDKALTTTSQTLEIAAAAPDIRLSTAAALSARFPIISPYGSIDDINNKTPVDEVVDGGYFENDGLATIADIASALEVDFGLQPVVIKIVNDPLPKDGEPPHLPGRPPLPPRDYGRTPFEGVTSIFQALTATRSGHEDDHESYLQSVLGEQNERLYSVDVHPLSPERYYTRKLASGVDARIAAAMCRHPVDQKGYMEQVSMSWWMSQPVQAYLDTQLCIDANIDRLICELQIGKAGGPGGKCS